MTTEEFLRGHDTNWSKFIKMFNYLIKIEYDGTNFSGWQSQKNGNTIQDSVETALKKIFKYNIKILG